MNILRRFYGERKGPANAGSASTSDHGRQHPNSRKESCTSLGVDVKCCRRQHQVLVTYIRHALQSWGPSDELPLSYWIDGAQSYWKPAAPLEVTPELNRVLTRAVNLSEDCCRELPPLEAALRHAERSESFADVLREIHWCTSVVFNTMECRKDLAAQKDFPWQAQLGFRELFMLEIAAQEDWQQLMGELRIWELLHHSSAGSAGDCGSTHCGSAGNKGCLAGQIVRGNLPVKFKGEKNHTPLLWSFDPDTVKFKGEKNHTPLLWSFDPDTVKFVRPLGSGSFGQVVEVTWLGLSYAQKIFNAAGLPTLRAEADALVKMNHPHIVKVIACSENSLLMDLMCMDLHKFMRRRMEGLGARVQPFSLPAAIDLMLQIAEAVSYLHSRKMAHRDLKSMNILVNPLSCSGADDGFVFAKIADFGLVKTKREITQYSHLTHNVGTKRWMAPEIFGANIEDDHLEDAFPMKADVYSFGIVCFEILSGEEPFVDVPASALYSKLTAPFPLRPRLPSSCPADLVSLVCACWDADPRDRPSFADVCRVLRYLKGLQAKKEEQGPWGVGKGPLTCEVRKGDITAFQVHFRDKEKLGLRGFSFSIGPHLLCLESMRGRNKSITDCHRELVRTLGEGYGGASTDWIVFDHPSEYLIQVEGSYSLRSVSSLSFITTKQKYGPFGTDDGPTTPFCSDPGIVVDCPYSSDGSHLLLLKVRVRQGNIVHCLRNFLGEDHQSARLKVGSPIIAKEKRRPKI